MKLIDAVFSRYAFVPAVGSRTSHNVLIIRCDCGTKFAAPSDISLVKCPGCSCEELWHGVDPKPLSGEWSEPVMENLVKT